MKDFTLEREGGKFTFEQGDFYFYAPVEGRVTGAVFVGNGPVRSGGEGRGRAAFAGPADQERHDDAGVHARWCCALPTARRTRFARRRRGLRGAPDGQVRQAAEDLAKGFRKDLHDNLDLRLLADVIGDGGQGEFFLASFRMGERADGKERAVPRRSRGDVPCLARRGGADDVERCRAAAVGGLPDGRRGGERPRQAGAGDGREAGRDVRPSGHDEELRRRRR